MSVIVVLILVSLILASGFLIGFFWAVKSGQYEDASTPAVRILLDDRNQFPKNQPPPTNPAITEK